MSKKVMIYAPFAIWDPHFETELEIAQDYIDKGYEIIFITCQNELFSCGPNPYHYFEKCWRCRSRFKNGIAWLGEDKVTIEHIDNLTKIQKKVVSEISNKNYNSVDEIRSIYLGNADIGLAAISSFVTILREPYPSVINNKSIIRDNIETAATVYFSILNHLNSKSPDIFILFNGRMSALRPALRAAQELNIDCYIHERAGVIGGYSYFKNSYAHDLVLIKEKIELVWGDSVLSDTEKEKLAREWYDERLKGVPQAHVSFQKDKKKGELPQQFDDSKINIGIFISSEEEFVAIEEWQNPFYKDQNEGITSLLNDLDASGNYCIYIRVHPNLSKINNSQTRGISEISNSFPFINVIHAEEKVDSYALVRNCSLILTYGSTMGIEACYLKKPSIVMGRAEYEDLDCCIKPSSHEELMYILNNYVKFNRLPEVGNSDTGVFKYGYYMKCKGVKFNVVKEHSFRKVSMTTSEGNNHYIRASILVLGVSYFILGLRICYKKIIGLFGNGVA